MQPPGDDVMLAPSKPQFQWEDPLLLDEQLTSRIQRLRDEIKFAGISELVEQIDRDIAAARLILAPHFEE